MLINELARKTGLSAHGIRFYEKEGLLGEGYIRRSENNYRHYTDAAVERVTTIRLLQTAGFTLAEIREHLATWDAGTLSDDAMIDILRQKRDEIDRKISELQHIRGFLDAKLALLQLDDCDAEAMAEVMSDE